MAPVETSRKRTRIFRQFSYGVGHVINDVTRLLIQSFRLVFLMKVVNMSASNAGWIIVFSRVTNAFIIRPMVGYLCDKVFIPVLSRRHGKRKSWHLIGTVLQAVSVPLLFSNCLVCSSEPRQWQLIVYYGIINTLAWLSMILIEIAHLSIIPFIAKNQQEAAKLNGLRMTLVFLTGTISYLVVFAILGQDNRDQLTAESSMDFTVLTLILIGTGLVFAVIFHIGTEEPSDKLIKRKRINYSKATVENDNEVLSNHTEVPLHKRGTNEQLSNGPEEVKSLEVTKCVELSSDSEPNKSEHGANNGAHVRNAEKKTVVTNSKHFDVETLGNDFEAFPSATTNSLGVDNKGFDCNETESTSCSPDEINVTKVDEGDIDGVESKSLEQNRCVVASETSRNKNPPGVSCDLESALLATPGSKTVRAWLNDPNLYKVAIVFGCTRALQDISYSYLPLFLTDRLNFQKEAIAYLPLVVLISATVSAGISKKLMGKIESKWSFILASLLVIGSCVWFYFITESTRASIYPAAALLGFGFSAMFINVYNFTTELIGVNKSNSGFVFSFLGISSSLIGGVLFGVIQNLFPRESESGDCEECGNYVHHVLSLVPGSLASISLLIVLMFQASHKTSKRNASKTDAATQTDTSMQTEVVVTEETVSSGRNQ